MRVVHVTPYLAPAWVYGGPPRTIFGLCRALRSIGIDVDVVTTTANGCEDLPASTSDGEVVDGIRVFRVPRRWPPVAFNAAVAPTIASALEHADLCHVHGLWNVPAWLAARHSRARQIPYVLSPRGMLLDAALGHHAWRKRLLLTAFERASIARAACIHATSELERGSLIRFADSGRIRIVPNGVDLPPDTARGRRNLRAACGIPAESPVVLFLGRIHPIKRLDLLARALGTVRARDPRVHLVIAGRDEADTLRTLQPLLAPLGDAVRIVGHVGDQDKWSWLAEASILVCCSDSENFGLSVAEAMAARVPVVVTRTCPWPDVEKAGAGFWVEPSVQALAEAIMVMVEDPVRASAMGENGRGLVERTYNWRSVASLMAQVYQEFAGDRAAAVA